MLQRTVDHLINNVLPSATDYEAAENALSQAFSADSAGAGWESEARDAKRKAANLAIAIDGLTDRCSAELAVSKSQMRSSIAAHCMWPGTNFARPDCLERVRGVANAYKHQNLTDQSLPIQSEDDVLVVGLAFGVEVFGAGKVGYPEVIVSDKTGLQWKFLADAPVAIGAWLRFLNEQGADLPISSCRVCNLQLFPYSTAP